jgi:hypothetical protein
VVLVGLRHPGAFGVVLGRGLAAADGARFERGEDVGLDPGIEVDAFERGEGVRGLVSVAVRSAAAVSWP